MTDLSSLFLSNKNKTPDNLLDLKSIKQVTKDDYMRIVQQERQKFVYLHFASVLIELFPRLRDDAFKMKRCHHTVLFECPDHFDVDK